MLLSPCLLQALGQRSHILLGSPLPRCVMRREDLQERRLCKVHNRLQRPGEVGTHDCRQQTQYQSHRLHARHPARRQVTQVTTEHMHGAYKGMEGGAWAAAQAGRAAAATARRR